MRKVVTFLLIFAIVISLQTPALANMEERLGKHWSSKIIDKDFLVYYFPYLAKEDFNRLNPNEPIVEDEFLLSFSSLLKNKGYSSTKLGWNRKLTRVQMGMALGEKLMEIELIKPRSEDIPFTDIDGISIEAQEALVTLYHEGLIKGQSSTKYNPYANVTQAEAIIVLQRVNELLDKVNSREIAFTLSGIVQTYSGIEGIVLREEADKVLVTITKKFPTPGYSVGVDKIVKTGDEYKVHLNITPPSTDSDQLQVITYKIMTIVIDKKQLDAPPYNFIWS